MKDLFFEIVYDQSVQQLLKLLINFGKSDPYFANYLGISYNQNEILSIKFYFCYTNHRAYQHISNYISNPDVVNTIKNYWIPPSVINDLNQGITLGFKCYLNKQKNNFDIKQYVHIRSKNIPLSEIYPLRLSNISYIEQDFGLCFEEIENAHFFKRKYIYFKNEENIAPLLNYFNIDKTTFSLNGIEYAEDNISQKIIIGNTSTNDLQIYLNTTSPQFIIDLSKVLKDKFKLYYYGPGVRKNSTTKAIHFMNKEFYYGNFSMNAAVNFLKT